MARSISGTLGVALSVTMLEQQRVIHAINLAQQQGDLQLPLLWTWTGLMQTFTGFGDSAGMPYVKTEAHIHRIMMSEATISAYQDIFILSRFISLFNIIPGLLRKHDAHSAEPVAPTVASPPKRTIPPPFKHRLK